MAVAKLGVIPGAFNPPTRAHMALAKAALAHVDQVLFVLPRTMPHKEYSGVSYAQRLGVLRSATAGEPRFAVAEVEGGLYVDIARQLRAVYGTSTEITFLCGRDAAERIVTWKYDEPGAVERMFQEFGLLVASRGGEFEPPPEIRHAIRPLELEESCDEVSATEVRERMKGGRPWRHLVPENVADEIERLWRGI